MFTFWQRFGLTVNQLPPLSQTLDEVESEYQKGIVLKAVDENNTIIGSVRAYYDKGTVYIGKLMVHPSKQFLCSCMHLIGRLALLLVKTPYEDLKENKTAAFNPRGELISE